jgi:hypothetical protein
MSIGEVDTSIGTMSPESVGLPHRDARLVVASTSTNSETYWIAGNPRTAPEADEFHVVVVVVADRFEFANRQSSEHGKQPPQNRSRG